MNKEKPEEKTISEISLYLRVSKSGSDEELSQSLSRILYLSGSQVYLGIPSIAATALEDLEGMGTDRDQIIEAIVNYSEASNAKPERQGVIDYLSTISKGDNDGSAPNDPLQFAVWSLGVLAGLLELLAKKTEKDIESTLNDVASRTEWEIQAKS